MIHIRNARLDEADRLTGIGLRAWEQAMAPIGETASMLQNAAAAFHNFTHSAWITISVIDKNGEPAGWVSRERLDEEITDFWIDPDFQRQGLGSALLAALEEEMAGQGLDQARLETHARNQPAIGFFEKHGYRIHALTTTYSPKLDRDIDTVSLSKPLASTEPETYGPRF
ncbi:N-acetyltransferase family protein [Rhizobium sp. PAMB 3174]